MRLRESPGRRVFSGFSSLHTCLYSRSGHRGRAGRPSHHRRLLQQSASSHLLSCSLRSDMATLRAAVFLDVLS